jgi:hypothetical protein
VLLALSILSLFHPISAFSVPGLIPTNYKRGDNLQVLVGRLFSPKTEIPYDFYELNWCNNTSNEGYDLNPVHKNIKGTDMVQSPIEVSN